MLMWDITEKPDALRATFAREQFLDTADIGRVPDLARNHQRHGDLALLNQGSVSLGQIKEVAVTRQACRAKNIGLLQAQALTQLGDGVLGGGMKALRHAGVGDHDLAGRKMEALDQKILLPLGNRNDFSTPAERKARQKAQQPESRAQPERVGEFPCEKGLNILHEDDAGNGRKQNGQVMSGVHNIYLIRPEDPGKNQLLPKNAQ